MLHSIKSFTLVWAATWRALMHRTPPPDRISAPVVFKIAGENIHGSRLEQKAELCCPRGHHIQAALARKC